VSKRILITGASGFIGANLTRRCLRDGHEVHLLLRPGYQSWRLDDISGSVHRHDADLTDKDAVRAAVRLIRPDWVFHLAAYGAYSSQTGMEKMVSTNLLGCVSLLDACTETGIEFFLNAGSSSEYGLKDHAPNEEEALEPNSHYAITKAAATHYCGLVARKLDINAVTVRLYSAFGPWEEPNRLIPTLIVSGFQGKLPPLVSPEICRDFVYVDDAVDAMVAIASVAVASAPIFSAKVPRGSVYNVCSGRQTNLREVVDVARRVMGITAEPVWSTMPDRSWDTDVWVGSGEKLALDVGWRAATAFDAGLEKTVAWFTAHPDRLRFYEQRLGSGSR
jgi:dolichol-phosphate mannosyltransferase